MEVVLNITDSLTAQHDAARSVPGVENDIEMLDAAQDKKSRAPVPRSQDKSSALTDTTNTAKQTPLRDTAETASSSRTMINRRLAIPSIPSIPGQISGSQYVFPNAPKSQSQFYYILTELGSYSYELSSRSDDTNLSRHRWRDQNQRALQKPIRERWIPGKLKTPKVQLSVETMPEAYKIIKEQEDEMFWRFWKREKLASSRDMTAAAERCVATSAVTAEPSIEKVWKSCKSNFKPSNVFKAFKKLIQKKPNRIRGNSGTGV